MEILHRGKTKGGEWVYGYYFKAKNHWHKRGVHEDWILGIAYQNGGMLNLCQRYAVLSNSVGIFTGRTDKKGTKIFSGDILKFRDRLCLVYWHEVCASFDLHFLQYTNEEHDAFAWRRLPSRWGTYAEVVGNAIDNPDLVEGVPL